MSYQRKYPTPPSTYDPLRPCSGRLTTAVLMMADRFAESRSKTAHAAHCYGINSAEFTRALDAADRQRKALERLVSALARGRNGGELR